MSKQAGLDERGFILGGLEDRTVAVIGDLMLDRYLQGDIDRISPEAPVPVIQRRSEWHVPGGAANVARNLASLGARVHMVGVTGADEARGLLIDALGQHGTVSDEGILVDAGRPTTQKLRIMSAHQQIARVDVEEIVPPSDELEGQLIAAATRAIEAADVVVLSDYGKGVLTDSVLRAAIAAAKLAGKPVLVDPKRKDWGIYRGASLITPNRRELSDVTRLACESDAEAEAAATDARRQCGADILLTRSNKGMSLFRAGQPPTHVPTIAQDVFDVSGAGDTVIAVLAAALAVGMEVLDAVKLANHAAGIVVAKLGTATITRAELAASCDAAAGHAPEVDGPLVTLSEAAVLRRTWKRQGLTVGVTNGCFDLLHPGHVSLIRQAAAACDRLIVALNSDASVARLKGPARPVQDEGARAAVIGALKGVSAVVVFAEDTPLELLRELEPDVLIKGADYAESEVVGADLVKERGGRIVLAALVPGRSTTALIRPLKAVAE